MSSPNVRRKAQANLSTELWDESANALWRTFIACLTVGRGIKLV